MLIDEMLQKIKYLQAEINAVSTQIDQLRAEYDGLRATDYAAPKVQGGMPQGLAERVERLELKINRLIELKQELLDFMDEVDSLIECMPTRLHRIVIRHRYLYRESWREIAGIIGVSREWVRKELHPKAIKEFESQLPKLPKLPK